MDWRAYQNLQRLVELREQFISYVDVGSGPPTVFLHGLPSWGFLWSRMIPYLATERRILIPDLLGFGYSDKSDRFDRNLAKQSDAIYEWLQKLGVEQADLVAHEIGGGVALRLAAEHPGMVRRLVLLDTVCYDGWPVDWIDKLGCLNPGSIEPESLMASLRELVTSGFHSTPDNQLVDGLLAPYRTRVGIVSLYRNAAALSTNQTTELTPRLPHISARTMILWGENDALQPASYGEQLAMDIPDCRLTRMADAGHFVMLDQPDKVVQELKAFLTL